MQQYTTTDIEALDRTFRLNLINSIAGMKPAALIGTKSANGQSNLAIFNSVVHIGSSPPMQGFMMRPHTVERHTLENIKDVGMYTINHVHSGMVQQAHYTSAKLPRNQSEFEVCKLTEEYHQRFPVPFVGESRLKMGMQLEEIVPIKSHDTFLIIGKILHLLVDEAAINHNGRLNMDAIDAVAVSGLNRYYSVQALAEFPYARPNEMPNFKDANA